MQQPMTNIQITSPAYRDAEDWRAQPNKRDESSPSTNQVISVSCVRVGFQVDCAGDVKDNAVDHPLGSLVPCYHYARGKSVAAYRVNGTLVVPPVVHTKAALGLEIDPQNLGTCPVL